MFRNLVKTAWRSLLRNKVVTTINVLGLAGNPATALNDPFRVVLTAAGATKYFGPGDPDQWLVDLCGVGRLCDRRCARDGELPGDPGRYRQSGR